MGDKPQRALGSAGLGVEWAEDRAGGPGQPHARPVTGDVAGARMALANGPRQ